VALALLCSTPAAPAAGPPPQSDLPREVFGVNPQVAHMGDIPGFTPQFPQMLAKADIPFMVMTRMGPSGGLRFALATPTEFFRRAAEVRPIPEKSGEIRSSWPNVATSLLHMWQLAVPATSTLSAAESFATVSHALGLGPYPGADLRLLWQRLIESMDHNHDGQGGAIGDERKMGYSRLVLLRGGEILRDSLRNIAERVEPPFPRSFPIVVFNPLVWARDDAVRAHVTLFGDVAPRDIEDFIHGMRLVDEKGVAVPFEVEEQSENISRALQIVFVARDVPSLGYRTYSLVPGAPAAFPAASRLALDRENDLRDPRRPLGQDTIENDFYRVTVDKATGRVAVFDKGLGREVGRDLEVVAVEERGGNNVATEAFTGRTVVNSVSDVTVDENGPVRTIARITGLVADIPIVQRVILYKELKRVDLENTVEWKGPRNVRLQQILPLPPAARLRYGVAFGSHDAADLMPGAEPHNRDELPRGAWEKYRQIQDWVFAGAPEWGLTVAADHQLVRLDEGLLRAEMIRGLRFTSVRVVRGDEVTLSSAPGDWRASRAYRQGAGFNQPLVPVSVADEVSCKTLPPTRSFASVSAEGLVVTAVKRSDDGLSVVVRFYEAEGVPSEAKVVWLGEERPLREANLLEEDAGRPAQPAVRVAAHEIKTIRIGSLTTRGARR
jgi:alpha-mannosidase